MFLSYFFFFSSLDENKLLNPSQASLTYSDTTEPAIPPPYGPPAKVKNGARIVLPAKTEPNQIGSI